MVEEEDLAILKENIGQLAINFRGITNAERGALFLFLKKLRENNERIKIVHIHSLRADIADIVSYAKNHFEVFTNIECLNMSIA